MKTKNKIKTKIGIERLIDEYFNNKVKCEELTMKGEGLTYEGYPFEYWHSHHQYQEARLQQLKEDTIEELVFLKKLSKILSKYHSKVPMIEIGRQNVLNDIDNELNLNRRIKQLKEVLK